MKWCWQWPCIFGLGSNFVAAPIFWAGFWFCNGSRIQTHFVKNTRGWYMLLVFCRWGSNIYFHIISDYLLVHIFLTRSEPPYKIRIRNHFLRVLSLNNKTKNHQIEPLQNGELHHSSSKVHQFQIVAFEPSSIMISYSSLGYLTGAFEPFQMAGGLGFGGSWETRFATTESGVQPFQGNF